MFLKVAVPGGGRTKLIVPVIEHPFLPNHFPPLQHGEHAASESCRKGKESVFRAPRHKANLRNKQGEETFASNLCTEVQRVGRGKGGSYRSTAGSAYPLGYEFAPRGCGQRLPNVVPSGADCPRRHWPQLDNCIFSSDSISTYMLLMELAQFLLHLVCSRWTQKTWSSFS